jgi:hypothetical protein
MPIGKKVAAGVSRERVRCGRLISSGYRAKRAWRRDVHVDAAIRMGET